MLSLARRRRWKPLMHALVLAVAWAGLPGWSVHAHGTIAPQHSHSADEHHAGAHHADTLEQAAVPDVEEHATDGTPDSSFHFHEAPGAVSLLAALPDSPPVPQQARHSPAALSVGQIHSLVVPPLHRPPIA